MEDIVKGKIIWKFGDHFNSDLIVGSKYIQERDPEVLRKACLADFDPEFSQKVTPGDVMIAGRNFGYGHPHGQGLTSLRQVGISALIAESFYPVWYRMAISSAFPVLTCPDIAKKADVGDKLEANFKTGDVKNVTTGETIKAEPLSPFLREIMDMGGMAAYIREKISTG